MEGRLKQYKIIQGLNLTSNEYIKTCAHMIEDLNGNTSKLCMIIDDLSSSKMEVRHGSCCLIGRLLDQPEASILNLSSSQRANVINAMVLSLSNTTDGQEAGQLFWTLKRDPLAMSEEMAPYVLTTLYACQRAATDIKSNMANRPSYAVAAGALQLIAKLYETHTEVMNCHTKVWFSLTLPYCSHGVSKLLRGYSQDIVNLSYDHLVEQAALIKSIVCDVSGIVIANITNILNKQYDEPSKLFAIKLWGLLTIVMGKDLENIDTTNLFLSALGRAFSKSYPERQAAAFTAWRLLITNLSAEYVLQPQVLKPLTIPLTKSNRCEDIRPLKARLDCWWTLVRKLGTSIDKHFTEICKPLLEFCLITDTSITATSGITSRHLINKLSSKSGGSPVLIYSCVAITLQFLGQSDTPLVDTLELEEEQKNVKLSKAVIRHSSQVLLQAVDECFKYLRSNPTPFKKDTLSRLLKSFQLLVGYIVELSQDNETDSRLVRGLVQCVVSIVIRYKDIDMDYTLGLLMPVLEFSVDILSSTGYTPSEINSFMKNPSICLLEIVWKSWQGSSGVEPATVDRFKDCVGKLVQKGCHPSWSAALTATYINNVTDIVQTTSLVNAATAQVVELVFKSLAIAVGQSLVKAKEVADIEPFVPIYHTVLVQSPTSALSSLLHTVSDDLLKIFRLDGSNTAILNLWRCTSERLQSLNSTLSDELILGLLPLLYSTLRHSNPAISKVTLSLWTNCLCEHMSGKPAVEFGEAVTQICKENGYEQRLVTGLPPSGSTKSPLIRKTYTPRKTVTSRKAVTPRSARKPPVSPTSPLTSGSKRRLILPTSPILSSAGKRPGREALIECFNEVQGQTTPTKKRKSDANRATTTDDVVNLSPSLSSQFTETGAEETTLLSQAIENSPESSQKISQCEEICTGNLSSNSQKISDETGNGGSRSSTNELIDSILPINQLIAAGCTTPKQPMKKVLIGTPGYPVVSPIIDSPVSSDLSLDPPATPMVFPAEKTVEDYQLVNCSVKLTKHQNPGTLLSSLAGSHNTDSQPRKRSSRCRKVVKRLVEEDTPNESSQSQSSSQSSSGGSQKQQRIRISPNQILDYSLCVSRIPRVKMISNTKTTLIKCNNVKVIKSMKSVVRRIGDDLCDSQASQTSQQTDDSYNKTKAQPKIKLKNVARCSTKSLEAEPTFLISESDPIDFGSVSTDSLFDVDEVSSPPQGLMSGSSTVKESSLQFDTLSATSSATSSSLTPIPPRISAPTVATGNMQPSSTNDTATSSSLDSIDSTNNGVPLDPQKNLCVDEQASEITSSKIEVTLLPATGNEKPKCRPLNNDLIPTSNESTGSSLKSLAVDLIKLTGEIHPEVEKLEERIESIEDCIVKPAVEEDIDDAPMEGDTVGTSLEDGIIDVPSEEDIANTPLEEHVTDIPLEEGEAHIVIEQDTANTTIVHAPLEEGTTSSPTRESLADVEESESADVASENMDGINMSQFDEEMVLSEPVHVGSSDKSAPTNDIPPVVGVAISSSDTDMPSIELDQSFTSTSNSVDTASSPGQPSNGGGQTNLIEVSGASSMDGNLTNSHPSLSHQSSTSVSQNNQTSGESLPNTSTLSPRKSSPDKPSMNTRSSPRKSKPNLPSSPVISKTSSPTQSTHVNLSTPLRLTSDAVKKVTAGKPSPSPSRAQKMLLLSSRSSQILAKSKSSKNGQHSTSNGNMSHVDTLPATPRSRKLNIEALELDCTPIHSPTTGSILKRRNQRSPLDGSTSKKVKFSLPANPNEETGSAKRLRRFPRINKDDELLAMYSPSQTKPAESDRAEPPQVAPSDSNQSQSQGVTDELPIASEYTASELPITDMICHLATPVWQGNLKQCLVSQGINTVGEMAKLTETDINLLPIKQPKLSTTLKAFRKSGATKNNKKPQRLSTSTLPPPQTNHSQPVTATDSSMDQRHIATEQPPVAIDQPPVETDQLPAVTDQLPVATDQLPVATDQLPVATDQLPVAIDQLRSVNHFTQTKLDIMLKMASNQAISDSQLGSEFRSLFLSADNTIMNLSADSTIMK